MVRRTKSHVALGDGDIQSYVNYWNLVVLFHRDTLEHYLIRHDPCRRGHDSSLSRSPTPEINFPSRHRLSNGSTVPVLTTSTPCLSHEVVIILWILMSFHLNIIVVFPLLYSRREWTDVVKPPRNFSWHHQLEHLLALVEEHSRQRRRATRIADRGTSAVVWQWILIIKSTRILIASQATRLQW